MKAVIGAALCLLSWPVWSAENPITSPLAGGGLLQMVLGLVLVLGFILGAAWLVRRFTPLRGGDGAIRLRGGLSLGTRERLVLVEVEGVRLLVGVSPGRLQ
ncbi:MAG: flagellar biosynthetic protein FliO, partial [Candidatus Competibacteraceae bacterium]|nr:flagellar biosynthetic protein FliO [Candidatus Competibacteraceae bacterium]